MTALINQIRGFLSFKTSMWFTILATGIFVVNLLLYMGHSPTVWVGDCTAIAGKSDPLAECVIGEGKVFGRINIKQFYEVLANHKTLWCSADTQYYLYCDIK